MPEPATIPTTQAKPASPPDPSAGKKQHGVPPGPPIPFFVQGAAVGLAIGSGRDLSTLRFVQRAYGDMFSMPIPLASRWLSPAEIKPKNLVFVAGPELVKQVFAGDPKTLHAGEESPLRSVLGNNSLLAIDEEKHLEQRKLILPPFHGKRMHTYEGIVEEETLKELVSWPVDKPFRTLEPMTRITLNVILRTVFGVTGGPLMEELRREVPRAINVGSRMVALGPFQLDLGPRSPWGWFVRQRRRFGWAVNTLVDQARHDPAGEERTDVLSMFALARHEDGSFMTDDEIGDQLMTIVAAGHETTATTLAWAFERLRRHPNLVQRLVDEVDEGGQELRDATIYEIQRTRPVIPGAGRITRRPFELGDYILPRDTIILLAAPLLHNDPRVYPNPAAFSPDRFVGRRPSPYEWIPFGGGIRRCPGAAFAHMEMDNVLRTVLGNLELDPTDDGDERSFFRGVAFAPGKGGLAVVRPRS